MAKTPHSSRARSRRSGFTLMEMLIVLGIIGLLMGILAVGFGGVSESAARKTAEMAVNQALKTPLTAYKLSMGSYPSTEEGLAVLLRAPAGEKARRWTGPYADTIPDDPWGNPYQYRYPGQHNTDRFDLWSMGPDGRTSEDDIGNW